MKHFLVIFLVCLLASCTKKSLEKKHDEVYVISEKDSGNNLIDFREEDYYSKFNLILGDSNKIYCFNYFNHSIANCIPSDNPPHFLNLKPSDLILLPYESIDKFIELNNDNPFSLYTSIYNIASPYDSIKSKAFEKIMAGFASVKQKKYIIRRTTFEEDQVLYHKINHLIYYPEEINWDTTKVFFSRKKDIEQILKVSQEKFKK